MATLQEEQWEIDGYVFGGNGNHRKNVFVLHSGMDFGSAGIRTQDVSRAGADGFTMGRDYVDAPEIQLTLGVEHPSNVWGELEKLARAWRPSTRLDPGQMSVLRYMRNGVVYRYYGRPRKIATKPAVNKNDQLQVVEVSFQRADPLTYVEEGQAGNSVTLRLIPSMASGGVVFPVTFPVTWANKSQARASGVTVRSTFPTPFEAWIKGPVTGTLSNIVLSGPGWTFKVNTTLAWDQTLYINTRTQVIQRNGVAIPGALSRDSRLSARLQPGTTTINFDGVDPSNTATARVVWFDSIPI